MQEDSTCAAVSGRHDGGNTLRGFTLVEVIVVSVIVAALAMLSVLILNGYVRDSRTNTAENLAASAASYLNSVVNVNAAAVDALDDELNGPNQWALTLSTGNVSIFKCPNNFRLVLDKEKKEVQAFFKADESLKSLPYKYNQ